jgi:DNA mismatch repair protein MutS2
MKALELLDDSAALALEFEWLRGAVAPVSPYGERIFEGLRPFTAGDEPKAQARAQRIAGVSQRVPAERIDAVRGVLRDVPDATPAIARAAIGGALDDPSFLELRRFGVAIAQIDELLADDAPLENTAVRRLREMLDAGQDRETEFYLSDAFDDSLAAARRGLMQAQAELDSARGRESERAARELGRAELGEEFIVMRVEHSGPLPQGVRVMREAATYFLCTLEYGDAALDALRRRDHAATALAAAEESVRARISDFVRNEARGLEAAAAALGELDVLFAAAHFTRRFGCLPATVVDEPALAFEGARFLPLEAELAAAGRPFVPLEIELHDAAVLTGPNMGGKSVALRTCGFVAVCAAFGLPVPAARARLGLFDRVAWLGIGREERMGGLLSSFAREVLALKELLTSGGVRLLVLADEFARTTNPREGKALVVALLERLRARGACGLAATHLEGVAEAAGARHFAVRGLREIPAGPAPEVESALAALAGSMDYRLSEVTGDGAARADAIALAALLGVEPEYVEAARAAFLK